MHLYLECLLAFISGAVYEAARALWVHFTERGHPFRAALFSMVVATCQIVGISEALYIHSAALCFIFGYGVGSFTATTVKARWTARKKRERLALKLLG